LSFKRYLVLVGVIVFGAVGDCSLSRGMRQVGEVSIHNLWRVELAFLNPWVICGVLLLMAYFATYLSSLSWADLTYVLPASASGYIVIALIARFVLHEHVTPVRWLGLVLIVGGVGFVAGGSHVTTPPADAEKTQPVEARR
jgi:drug/metabolite transporter (DMT)-like permease